MKNTLKMTGMALSLLVAAGLMAAAPAGAAETKTIKAGIGLNEQSPQYKGLLKFKELVEAESKGRFKVDLFANAQLGDDAKMMTSLRAGTLEMTCPSTAPIAGLDRKWMVFDLPFLFPNEEVADKVLDGPFGQKYLDSLPAHGIIGMSFWENGFRQLTNSKVEVKSPADLKGLKIRTMENPVHLATFKTLGANPTPMPFSEIFSALSEKTIDGQENPSTTNFLQKYYEVQKFTTLSNHFYSPFVFMYSKKLWDTLSKEDQALILKAAKEAGAYQRKINRETMGEAVAGMEKAGMTVTRLTPEQHRAFVDATKDIAGQFEKDMGADNLKAILEEIAKAAK
ncbi:MAG: TRAP transporter substrate-binding protein [Candidatus Accumulibacter sp.]|jgi:tripartite ATP-independent transporter DctP family solute receptor|nr:TRAP transporter substrate-binding protein [Accumulibacter sp.]